MSTEMAVAESASTVLIKFTETTVTEAIKKAVDVTLKGVIIAADGTIKVVDSNALIDDAEGLAKVTEMRKKVVKTRTAMESEQKKLKEDAWAECKRLDAERNTLLSIIAPVESRLKGLEKCVEDELAAAVERRLSVRENARRLQIDSVGGIPELIAKTLAPNFIRVAEDPQFSDWLMSVQSMNEQIKLAEKARKEKEEADRIEAKRLADEKAERDRLQAIEDEKVRAENKRVADELAEKQRQLDQQAADQKAAQEKIDAENSRLAKVEADRVAAEAAKNAPVTSIPEKPAPSPYEGNTGSAWRFDRNYSPRAKMTMSSKNDIADYASDMLVIEKCLISTEVMPKLSAPWKDEAESVLIDAIIGFNKTLMTLRETAERRSQGES